MPDPTFFPPPTGPVKAPKLPDLPTSEQYNRYKIVLTPLNVLEAQKMVGGKLVRFIDDKVFEDKVVDPALTAVEEFLEEKAAKFPLKRAVSGPALFVIEHTIISHTSKSADPNFVTVQRPDGTTYRYADLSAIPRRLAPGEIVIDAPPGTQFIVTPPTAVPGLTSAGGPLGGRVATGSIQTEKISPVEARAIDNENRAEGIRRQLASERADP
jgi:hypothetical protein